MPWILLLLLIGSLPAAAKDDPVINRAVTAPAMVVAELERGRLLVDVELTPVAWEAYGDLLPAEPYAKVDFPDDHVPEPFEERLARFWKQGLVLRLDGGEPLEGRLLSSEARPRTERDLVTTEILPKGKNEGAPCWKVRLEYRFEGLPKTLEIRPPMDPYREVALTTTGFQLRHEGQWVHDFRFLHKPETCRLDWEDPFYSRFSNRLYMLTSGEAVQGFVYVEALEVRKEIVLRPKDLQGDLDLGLADAGWIRAGERKAVLERIEGYLSTRARLSIDGRASTGVLDRIHLLRRSIGRTDVIPAEEDVAIANCYVGAIYLHPVEDWPDKVVVTWDLFVSKDGIAIGMTTDLGSSLPIQLTEEEPFLVWENLLEDAPRPSYLTIPPPAPMPRMELPGLALGVLGCGLLSLWLGWRRRPARWPAWSWGIGLAALISFWPLRGIAPVSFLDPFAVRPMPDEEASSKVLEAQLQTIYKAFDRREEGVIYDTLARCVSGELLQRLYLDTRRSLEAENQGGARVRLENLEVQALGFESLPEGGGFESHARWRVDGAVGHWGHAHQRSNLYEGRFRVEVRDGVWKLTALELIDEKRI